MNRRTLLKTLGLGLVSLTGRGSLLRDPDDRTSWLEPTPADGGSVRPPASPPATFFDPPRDEGTMLPPPTRDAWTAAANAEHSALHEGGASAERAALVARLRKIDQFDSSFEDDYHLEPERLPVLEAAAARLGRTQRMVGHGHFNLLGFDRLLDFARNYPEIGEFERAELELVDELFFADAARYGFYGERVTGEMTAVIPDREVVKVAGTGHYLLSGEPLAQYKRIRRDLGDTIVLTSGVRSVVKQMHLFLTKAVTTGGNLSQASRSLAPPGYSFHAAGDFDVGKVGFGLKNFSASFAETHEFRRLIDLGYVGIRYTRANAFGVRYEPWHIKMT